MSFSHNQLCAALGKPSLYVHNIQKYFSLPVLKADEKYSEGHKMFLERIINLKTLGVSSDDIVKLLVLEKTILHLLQIDSLNESPTWYLDHCSDRYLKRNKPFVLMLTDFELEDSPLGQSMQGSLDFAEAHPKELFKAADMGEDINRAIEKYRELEGRILAIVDREVGVTQKATDWAKSILRKKKG
jgi:hypothetical protein